MSQCDHLQNASIYTYTWDTAGRLITVTDGITTLGFLYDGDGNRLARVVNGTFTTHTLDVGLGLPEVLVEHGSGTTRYLHPSAGSGQGLPTAVATDDGAWTYSAADGLGSVRQRLDASGQVAAVNDYRPFGAPLAGDGGSPYGYTGEWWEDDAGLLFLRARYLQPETGRFISRDPWPGQVGRPGTLNRYAYLLNDPINASDPSGKCPPGVPECRDEQGRPIDSYYLPCRPDWPCFFKEQLRGPSDPELFEILQARRLRVRDYRPFCEYARLHPKTEELVKQHASRYGVPWQIVAGVLYAEAKTDKGLTDILGDMFWSRTSWPVTDMAMQYVWLDPGSGIGNVHVTPAQYVSKYFAEHYPENAAMQLYLHDLPRTEIPRLLTIQEVNINAVAAFVRQLADYRFGSNQQPSLRDHSDLSEWTLTDAAAIWHAYRYGVPKAGPGGWTRGFRNLADFQDRDYNWQEGLQGTEPKFIGRDAERSIRDAIPFLRCYLERCNQ